MDGLLDRAAEELFTRHAPSQLVRALRAGGSPAALWGEIEASGFLDALVPEAAGGAGLGPADALPVAMAAGRFAVPLPVAETMLGRAALSAAGAAVPEGAIVLAEPAGGGAARLPPGGHADWALLPMEGRALLLPVAEGQEDAAAGSPLGRVVRWPGNAGRPLPTADYETAGAWAEVAAMAGAMQRILESTVLHARERQQFGRPVASFQAVQQQISVMTEDVFAARLAAQLASVADGDGVAGLNRARVAAAKLRVGEAAVRVAAIAHGVQGAMGITEEVDLHLFTARLQLGRTRFGGEARWGAWLGRRFLEDGAADTLLFVRTHLAPAGPETTP